MGSQDSWTQGRSQSHTQLLSRHDIKHMQLMYEVCSIPCCSYNQGRACYRTVLRGITRSDVLVISQD